jgi:hypothetical protein
MFRHVRRATVIATLSAAALVVPAVGASAAPPTPCPPGYSTPGLVTPEGGLTQPRIQAGLAAGAYTVEDLAAVFESIDKNGDGLICLKAVSNLSGNSGKNLAFFYNGKDNRSN